jgi:hypothetical protein
MATLEDSPPLQDSQTPMDPFKSHLVALLSVYELGPFPPVPIPRYDGPADWHTDTILNSLSLLARRMWSAEELIVKHKLSSDTIAVRIYSPIRYYRASTDICRSS